MTLRSLHSVLITLAALALSWKTWVVGAQESLPGLLWVARDGQRTVQFVTPTPNFALAPQESLHAQLAPAFSAECIGLLKVPQLGRYTIHADVPIWVSGNEVQNRVVKLDAGELPIRIAFDRKPGKARLQLLWESEYFGLEPIPASAFTHRDTPAVAAAEQLVRGRELVEELGCVACHHTRNSLLQKRGAPDLADAGTRLNSSWVFRWLDDPRHFRNSAAMPNLLRSAKERADVTAYLFTLRKAPDHDAKTKSKDNGLATSTEYGKQLFTRIGCAACHGEGGVALTGSGSKFAEGQLALYLQNPLPGRPGTRMPDFSLTADEAAALSAFLSNERRVDYEQAPPAGDADRGRVLIASRGCAACHVIRDDQGTVASTLESPAFESIDAERGCLARNPSVTAAYFALNDSERSAIKAFLRSPDVSEAPLTDVPRLVARFRCATCHEFNGPATFSSGGNQAPPSLSEIGNRLRPEWLDGVLHQRQRSRSWLELRMPHYGDAALAPLVRGFPALAGVEHEPTEASPPFAQVRSGARLIGSGEGGLSCITCHDCLGERSTGDLRGPDLAGAQERLRGDWIRRWLREPSRIAPGTAMPAFFTALSATEREQKIGDILAALSAGRNMPAPVGLRETTADFLLTVTNTPVVVRGFLPGSSPRSIAVGLPGGLSYCFDAESCRLRYAWSGEFLNMKPVWWGRGGERPEPRGVKFHSAPDIFPLRLGQESSTPVVKFLGYTLVNKLPEFRFTMNGVAVKEQIDAAPGGGLRCRFILALPPKKSWGDPSGGIRLRRGATRLQTKRRGLDFSPPPHPF